MLGWDPPQLRDVASPAARGGGRGHGLLWEARVFETRILNLERRCLVMTVSHVSRPRILCSELWTVAGTLAVEVEACFHCCRAEECLLRDSGITRLQCSQGPERSRGRRRWKKARSD